MTRKKYERDLEGEAIREVYGKDDSESEEEEAVEEYDPWSYIQQYINDEIRNTDADWICKWFDACDIHRIIEAGHYDENAGYYIPDYLFPSESIEHVNCLLDHMWNLHDICRIEPDLVMLYSATLELLAERTKYYYVNSTVPHRHIVNRKFFLLERRSSVPCTNSQQ